MAGGHESAAADLNRTRAEPLPVPEGGPCERFRQAWEQGRDPRLEDFLPPLDDRTCDPFADRELCASLLAVEIDQRWRRVTAAPGDVGDSTVDVAAGAVATIVLSNGQPPPPVEELTARFPNLLESGALPVTLIAAEYRARHRWGDKPGHAEYLARFPAQQSALSAALSAVDQELSAASQTAQFTLADQTEVAPPAPDQASQLAANEERTLCDPDLAGAQAARAEDTASQTAFLGASGLGAPQDPSQTAEIFVGERPDQQPAGGVAVRSGGRIGRYLVEKHLAEGGFGTVFLALDEELGRRVAIKMPRASQFADEKAIAKFMDEARISAGLNHPGIVTIFDVGRDETGRCFVVMEYLPGRSLEDLLTEDQLSPARVAELMAEIADAVAYAHKHHLIHRDLKPANILFDGEGRPRVADFGLALHVDAQRMQKGEISGTPSYMAPEQVRGETHRFDGRTDLWALGAILYRALCRQVPFAGKTIPQVFQKIQSDEPTAPRLLEPAVPVDLERIALKCLAKRMGDRFSSVAEFAAQLRLSGSEGTARLGAAEQGPTRIVPRGLRSFNSRDAEFFLRLLPGPVDREGIPESIRVWKEKVEEFDADQTFSVGLLYGPTGCGKSSLVRAGLLPHLNPQVSAIYIEAKPDQTEAVLLRTLYKLCPSLPDDLTLPEAILRLREGKSLPTGQKVCIFLDQFEQWLHARRHDYSGELLQALRHCDGAHVQCVIMVRDDFWLAVSRFLRELEVPLVEGQNAGLVDLFDFKHAVRVLTEFGVAYERLSMPPTVDQRRFLEAAVAELSQDAKVISVRLALFAEMMKNRDWTLESLEAVGGCEGLGTTFLEETFLGSQAKPEYRQHEAAVRAVLAELLPEAGTAIKGRMRARDELLAASGYQDKPQDFQDVMRILDSELRLITPTDPDSATSDPSQSMRRTLSESMSARETQAAAEDSGAPAESEGAYYQLAHDYLVPQLRDWLTQKQKQSPRGRATLRLAELAGWWNAKPEPQRLPGVAEWAGLWLHTSARDWTPPQRTMMHVASRRYLFRLGGIAALVVVAVGAFLLYRGRVHRQQQADRGAGLLTQLVRADISEVPAIAREIREYLPWTEAGLRNFATIPNPESKERLHAAVALHFLEGSQTDYLADRLLDATVEQFPIVRDTLREQKDTLAPRLWQTLHDAQRPAQQRFHAGLALADFTPAAGDWSEDDLRFLAERLVKANPDQQKELRNCVRPMASRLLDPLRAVYLDRTLRDTVCEAACVALADFAADRPAELADLVARATPAQYALLEPTLLKLHKGGGNIAELLIALTREAPPDGLSPAERVTWGARRAGAAIAAVRLGARADVFGVFHDRHDPEAMSQFVHGLKERGVAPAELLECLDQAQDDRSRFGLLLALGEYPWEAVPDGRKTGLLDLLTQWHVERPDAGLHAATEWLLRRWGQLERLAAAALPGSTDEARGWYVENAGADRFTMIVQRPREIRVGSPDDEPGRTSREGLAPATIPYTWAIADREVTRGQFARFLAATQRLFPEISAWSPSDAHPAIAATWFEAVLYCRWLTREAGMSESDQCYPDPESPDLEKAMLEDGTTFPKDWPVDVTRSGYRLPLEIEWETACRAGTTTPYSFGGDRRFLPHYGWFVDNEGKKTHECATLRPNPGGLFDIHGNVLEWCHDWLSEKYPTPADPNPPRQEVRVYRGGAWDSGENRLRSAHRDAGRPANRLADCGIRLVRTLPTQ